MLKIKILLENTSLEQRFKAQHGLAVLIEQATRQTLLDLGSDATFLKNASELGVALSQVSEVFLSHAHYDHTGGLDAFCELNQQAPIYLFDQPNTEYYSKLWGVFPFSIGLRASEASKQRIISLKENLQLTENLWFMRNSVVDYPKPSANQYLFVKRNGLLIEDDFSHEGTLVIKDEQELVICNSCSHGGVLNIMASVQQLFPGQKIRSYLGGMHLSSPTNRQSEDPKILTEIAAGLAETETTFYTGHCTGEVAFEFLASKLGEQIKRISTGMELLI